MGMMWSCCEDTSSDDDEHNTDNTLLLLVADALIAPVLLSGLSDVDELMVALGCRFALDLFSVAQHDWAGGPPQCDRCCARGTVAELAGMTDVAASATTTFQNVQPESGNFSEHGQETFTEIDGAEPQYCVSAGAQLEEGILSASLPRGRILSQG